jgi:hypothetical protein
MSANTIPGTANNTSSTHEMAVSTLPPHHAAVSASMVPTTVDNRITSPGPASVYRAPNSRRERMSRPSASVPNQCVVLGLLSTLSRSGSLGSKGAMTGAKVAANTMTASVSAATVPSMPSRLVTVVMRRSGCDSGAAGSAGGTSTA